MARRLTLFFIVFLEGYIVLATELLAIRQTIPYVGSGTDTISIVIAAVLMPLAFGYYSGGVFSSPLRRAGYRLTVRRKLVKNMLVAALFLLPGLSLVTVEFFFDAILGGMTDNRLIMITAYVLVFLVIPVFLLGQTIPLVTHFFARARLRPTTGKILFFSTAGSFLGAVVPTLVVMTYFGVNYAVMLNFLLLGIIVILLAKDRRTSAVAVMLVLAAYFLNAPARLATRNIVADNQYHTITVKNEKNGGTQFIMNNAYSSYLGPDHEKHAHIAYVEKTFLKPLSKENAPPGKVLVIGTGGFAFGADDSKNLFTYVDIDASLQELAERFFLKEELGDNKTFKPLPARAFLATNEEKFDLVFLDIFLGFSTPEQIVTREFFQQVKNALAPGGIIVWNIVTSPNFQSAYSRNIDTTLHSVFPYISRQVIGDFDAWSDNANLVTNVLYFYRDVGQGERSIYTDNKNAMVLDRPRGKY